jgi:hypothetical protein
LVYPVSGEVLVQGLNLRQILGILVAVVVPKREHVEDCSLMPYEALVRKRKALKPNKVFEDIWLK